MQGLTYSLPNSIETITITPIPTAISNPAVITAPTDTDTDTPGHQATLQNGVNSFTARVTDNTDSSNTKNHTITINRADGSSDWDPTLDITLDRPHHFFFAGFYTMGNLVQQGTTMWVA